MIVSLPSAALNDCRERRTKFFEHTPSIKQLIDTVLYQQPRKEKGNPRRNNSKELYTPPEDETVIAAVEHSSATQDQKQVVRAIAGHLMSMLDESVSMPEFEGKQVPSISIHDYVDRLIRYVDAWAGEKPDITSTGVSAALMGIEYLDRLNHGISAKSIHRLYMCAVLVSVKFSEDFTITNRFWAKVAGIDLEDMNRLEINFCKLMEWKLKVSREDFESQQNRFSEPMF